MSDLASAGFAFEADVAFVRDPYVVCDGLRCADVRVRAGRRTILLSPDAFATPSRLRASLLEVWGRYLTPHAPTQRGQAESALRILRDGPRAGVHDSGLLRRAHQRYRQLFAALPAGERTGLPDPDDLPYPLTRTLPRRDRSRLP